METFCFTPKKNKIAFIQVRTIQTFYYTNFFALYKLNKKTSKQASKKCKTKCLNSQVKTKKFFTPKKIFGLRKRKSEGKKFIGFGLEVQLFCAST